MLTELAASEQAPIFISIDDTVVNKTKPSSKAKRPTEGAGWHYSHLEGKVIYGFLVHVAIVNTGKNALCYSLKRYNKEGGTKVEMTLDVIKSLLDQAGTYILIDSWYTNPDILDECREKGCCLIGANENQPNFVSKWAKNVRHGLRPHPLSKSVSPCNGERPRVSSASV